MRSVAIAGGTSKGLGRSIVQAIISTYPQGEWKPVILSRSDKTPEWLAKLPKNAYDFHKVDYTSPQSLEQALHGCHTVISVILGTDESHVTHQVALLKAAEKVGCKRFAPSEWSVGPKGTKLVTLLNATNCPVWEACEQSSLEWARFNVGVFMNYLAIGCSNDKMVEQEACIGVDRSGDMPDGSGSYLLSLSSATAEVPLTKDGGYPTITLSEINNIGEYVAASLALEKWERDMNIVGSNIRLDELIGFAETILGRSLNVEKLSIAQIKQEIEQLKADDIIKKLWLEVKLISANNTVGEALLEPVVNVSCPQVKVVDVETFLRRHWQN